MAPKNPSATSARTSAVRMLAARCAARVAFASVMVGLTRMSGNRLCDHGWCFERMVWRRRRQRPLQPGGAVPHLRGCLFAPANALDHGVQEQQLGQAESERTDAGDHVEIRELQRIVGE